MNLSLRSFRMTVVALVVVSAGPALSQGYEQRPAEDGPSMNSFDMWTGRAGGPRANLTTKIVSIDAGARTLTADNGDVFAFANNITAANLRPGQSVMLTWEQDGARKILHGITPITN